MKYLTYRLPKANSFGHSRKSVAVIQFDEMCERFKHEVCRIGHYHTLEMTVRFYGQAAVAGVEIIKDLQHRMGGTGVESVYIQGYDPPSASCTWKLADARSDLGDYAKAKSSALKLYLDTREQYDGDQAVFEVSEAVSFFFKDLAGYDERIAELNEQERKQMASLIIMTNGSDRYVQPTFNFPLTDGLGIAKEAIAQITRSGLFKLAPHHFRIVEIAKNRKMILRKLPAGSLP